MKNLSILLFVWSSFTFAAPSSKSAGEEQREYEKSINAVVRAKHYYKPGKFEAGIGVGTMPYDSIISHYLFGGRFTWHITDHFGWEVLDAAIASGSVSGFTTDLVTTKGISNLQTIQIKTLLGSNFVASPFHGKVRLFGSSVVHFDAFAIAGLGFANTDVLKFSSPGENQASTQTIQKTGWDLMLSFGIGFKFFVGDSFAILFDARDYLIRSETYGSQNFKSNYAAILSASMFFPSF